MADKRKPMICTSFRAKRTRHDSCPVLRRRRFDHGDLHLSGPPVRFLFLERSQWREFPADITESLRSAVVARRPVAEFSIGNSRYLINFSQKLQLNMNTCYLRSIAWIDDCGKRFFPVKCFEGYGPQLVKELKALRSASVDSMDSSPCHDADLVKESIVIMNDRSFPNGQDAELDLRSENSSDVKNNSSHTTTWIHTDVRISNDSGLQHGLDVKTTGINALMNANENPNCSELENSLDINQNIETANSGIGADNTDMNPKKTTLISSIIADVNPNGFGSVCGLDSKKKIRSSGIEFVKDFKENFESIPPSEYNNDLSAHSSQDMSDVTSTDSSNCPNDEDGREEYQSKPPTAMRSYPEFTLLEDKIVRLNESHPDFRSLEKLFLNGLGKLAPFATVTGISRDCHRSMSGLVREQAFKRQEEATRSIRGDSNVRYCWYSTSKQGVSSLVLHGFGQPSMPLNGAMYGVGVYLSPEQLSYISAIHADIDDNGEQHVVLCRAIMGNMEQVPCGSHQYHPSNEDYDSGVDDQYRPKRYIVWSTHMNTHILPEYIISFKLPPHLQDILATLKGKQMFRKRSNVNIQENQTGLRKQLNNDFNPESEMKEKRIPKSPWMSFPVLFSVMKSKISQEKMELLQQYYLQFKAGRISRSDLIRAVRFIAGDQLVVNTIKSMQMQSQALGAVFVQNLLASRKNNVVNNNIIA